MTRLKQVIDLHDFYRFVIIYGPGISDIYFHEDGSQLDFQHSLTEELQEKGYQRILHISPTKPVHILDSKSEKLSANHLWKDRNDVLTTGIIKNIKIGPLGIAESPDPHSQEPIRNDGLGDVNGLRIIDAMVKEESNFRTGLVIYNSEVFLQCFSNKRILGGLLSEWLQLPLNNQNSIFFVFTNTGPEDLFDSIKNSQVPELKSLLYSEHVKTSPEFFVEGPNQQELSALLRYLQVHDQVDFNVPNTDLFLKWLEGEGVLIRTWYDRFSPFSKITLDIVRSNGWLISNLGDSRSLEEKLDDFVGLIEIKERILEIRDWMRYQQNKPLSQRSINLHMVFYGNPGTGKTTLARLMGEMFHDYGILRKGQLIEAKASDLIADIVGGTAQKTNRLVDRAIGGVLFIDEAYSLSAKERGGFGQEAIETLLIRMENDRSRIVVILAGYPEKMREFLASNPGLDRRFPKENRFEFHDFTQDELETIFIGEITKRGLGYDQEFIRMVPDVVRKLKTRLEGFGNAGEVRNLADGIERRCKARTYKEGLNTPIVNKFDLPDEFQDIEQTFKIDNVLSEFGSFVGLEKIKNYLVSMVRLIQLEKIRQHHNFNSQTLLENFIFLGNPGTGKTSVARIIGRLYKSLGLLERGHVVEVSAANLVAGYVGQTQEKTKNILLNAIDGVLFIDEAYALTRNSSFGSANFGQEALDVIVKYMEDFRDRLVVIAAGYPDEMFNFINANPGLKSRFGSVMEFEDFTPEELGSIFSNKVSSEGFSVSQETIDLAVVKLENLKDLNQKNFGNAREVRKLFAYMKRSQANRIFQEYPNIESASIPLQMLIELLPNDMDGFEESDQSLNSLPYLLPQQFLPLKKKSS